MTYSLSDHKVIGFGTVAAAALASGIIWYRRHQLNKAPKKWMKIGRVTNLYIYPVKSCMGLTQSRLECTRLGGKIGELRDRMFVVVNDEGKFVTGRDHPEMMRISASVVDGVLRLSAADLPEAIEIQLRELNAAPREVRIWNARAEGIDCGDDVADWLTDYIKPGNARLRLLYCGTGSNAKEMNPKLAKALRLTNRDYEKSDAALYSDAAAYHLISECSVKDLNSRLPEETVTHRNFRPNIVVDGFELIPFEEDTWNWVKIGDVMFRFLSPCGRCVFTTVDPSRLIKSEKFEPVSTLRKFRSFRNENLRNLFQAPAMGIYLGARSEGFISVGDDVMIPQR